MEKIATDLTQNFTSHVTIDTIRRTIGTKTAIAKPRFQIMLPRLTLYATGKYENINIDAKTALIIPHN